MENNWVKDRFGHKGPVGRYLGYEHLYRRNVMLPVSAHPFAHVFDTRSPDPAAQRGPCVGLRITGSTAQTVPSTLHIQPRKLSYSTDEEVCGECKLANRRCAWMRPCASEGVAETQWDDHTEVYKAPCLWTGITYFFIDDCKDPKLALATVTHAKGKAKKQLGPRNHTSINYVVPKSA